MVSLGQLTPGSNLGEILGLGSPVSNNAAGLQALAGILASSTTVPTLEELRLQQIAAPQAIQYMGDVNIETATPTELRNILTDPRFTAAGFETLDRLKELQDTGMSAIDRARLDQIRQQVATEQRGAREAILANARQRGMGGSGMELAQQLLAQQEGANMANQEGLNIAAQAQQASTQAALERAGLARLLQEQSFGQQARTSEAQDLINRFNVSNRNQGNLRNQDLRQEIAAQNVANQNAVNQANVGLANQATLYNTTQRPVQQFNLQNQIAQSQGQGMQNYANQLSSNAQAQYGANAGLLGSFLNAGGTVVGGALRGGWGSGQGSGTATASTTPGIPGVPNLPGLPGRPSGG